MKYKSGQILYVVDHNNAPYGRSSLKVLEFNSIHGVYVVRYQDGDLDSIGQYYVEKFWKPSPLMDVLDGREV